MNRYDAIVIGAGPAGCAAALRLARQGHAVALVDRARFPRAKVCGGCLGGVALAELDALGLAETVQAIADPIHAMQLRCAGRAYRWPVPAMAAVRRDTFDAALAAAAECAGARWSDQTTAAILDPGNDARPALVELRHANHPPRTVEARAVVLADGLAGTAEPINRSAPATPNAPDPRWSVAPRARIGYGTVSYAPLNTPSQPPAVEPHTIAMSVGPAGYVGLAAARDGATLMAAALDPAAIRAAASPTQAVLDTLAVAAPPPIAAAQSALAERSTWRGTPTLSRHRRRLAWGRCIAIGDAARYSEPFTGEGMAWALTAARLAADPLDRAIRTNTPAALRDWPDLHRRHARRRLAAAVLRRAVRHPAALAAALRATAGAGPIARSVIQRIHPSAA
ncbi:MAG: FAD-dependent oxidoreductase [Planctomycetota bacterium]